MNFYDIAELQRKRREAYDDGEYNMSDWEGFYCTQCGNRQLNAICDLNGGDITKCNCDECDGIMETSGEETDWTEVRDKIPSEYLTGEAMRTDLTECPKCGSDIKDESQAVQISFQDDIVELHKRCGEAVWKNEIENPFWYDTFTPEHYESAADYLRSLDCVGCVITNNGSLYSIGEMYIHTNFCTTEVVKDVIDDFDGRVVYAGVTSPEEEGSLDCVQEHGLCFEILIDFCTDTAERRPPESLDRYTDNTGGGVRSQDYFMLNREKKQIFDANFDNVSNRSPEVVPDKYKN